MTIVRKQIFKDYPDNQRKLLMILNYGNLKLSLWKFSKENVIFSFIRLLKVFFTTFQSRNTRIIKHDFSKENFSFFECWFHCLHAEKVGLFKKTFLRIFFPLQMQKLFSKLSKTFERWINFPARKCKSFSTWFSTFFFIQKFLLGKELFYGIFPENRKVLHLFRLLLPCFVEESALMEFDENQSFEFIKLNEWEENFMKHIRDWERARSLEANKLPSIFHSAKRFQFFKPWRKNR